MEDMRISDDAAPRHDPRPRGSAANRHALLLLLTIALLVRGGLWLIGPSQDFERAMEPDSRRYVRLADNLIEHGSFAKAEEDGIVHAGLAYLAQQRGELPAADANGLRPEVFRTPGYPWLIAAVKELGWPMHAVLWVQCGLSVLGVWFVYAASLRLIGSRRAAMLAAGIAALHPAGWIAPNSVLAETLFTTLLLAGVYLLVRRDKSVRHAAAAGLVLGLAALVRPVGVLLGLAGAMWLAAANVTRRGHAADGIACAVVLLMASLLPTGLWMWRNAKVGAGFTLSTVPAVNGLYYTAAHVRIAKRGGDAYHDWPTEVAQLHTELGGRLTASGPDVRVMDAARQMAREQIKAEPALYARLLGRSAVKFFTDHSLGTLYERVGWTYVSSGLRDQLLSGQITAEDAGHLGRLWAALIWMGANGLLALMTGVGLLRLLWVGRWRAALLLGGMVFYFVLATQTNGLERFRWPVIGLQAVIAAAALFARPTSWGGVEGAGGAVLPDAEAVHQRMARLRDVA